MYEEVMEEHTERIWSACHGCCQLLESILNFVNLRGCVREVDD